MSKRKLYRSKHKKYLAEIKDIQEYYNPKKYRKHEVCKDWKETWKGFVECTYPWDGTNIFVILVYRLEILRANIRCFSHTTDGDKMITELDEAITLGRKIIEYDYSDEASKFSKEHVTRYAYIYKKGDTFGGKPFATIEMTKDDEFTLECMTEKNYISPLDYYLKENKLKEYRDVTVAYGGEWDVPENHDIWLQMIKDADKQRQVDKKKFYRILTNKLESWWD